MPHKQNRVVAILAGHRNAFLHEVQKLIYATGEQVTKQSDGSFILKGTLYFHAYSPDQVRGLDIDDMILNATFQGTPGWREIEAEVRSRIRSSKARRMNYRTKAES